MTNNTVDKDEIAKRKVVDNGASVNNNPPKACQDPTLANEVGGPKGPEPTRYGDWEAKGRCYDF